MAAIHSCSVSIDSAWTSGGRERFSRSRFRLPPAQKCSPSPVITIARTAGSPAARFSAAMPST